MVRAAIPWVPQIGLDFAFFVDGYGLFFACLILFIGLLIIIYARWYLGREDPIGRFYAYLLLFQGAMLGIVLSDNVLLLLVFWELTSLTSFLLIGYWRHLPEGRQGARMALVVTGAGGLCADRRHAAPGPGRRQLRADRDPGRAATWSRPRRSTCRSCSWSWAAPSPSRPSSRSISGCRTPWRHRRRSRPICTRRPW